VRFLNFLPEEADVGELMSGDDPPQDEMSTIRQHPFQVRLPPDVIR
jgi:hypothetical protein